MKHSIFKHAFVALLLCSLVTACGWHLRGQVDLPIELRILNLDAKTAEPLTANLIRQSLLSNGVTLSEDAPYTLKILGQQANRRVLSVTNTAKASEYELSETLNFQLLDTDNQAVSEELSVTSYRTLQYDANAEIGKAQEEQNLRREMKQYNAYNVLLRLKAVKLTPTKAK